MKISTFARSMAVALVTLCCLTGTALSQVNSTGSGMSPDRQMGLGLTAGNSLGFHFAYALNPGFHIGTGFGVALSSRSQGSSSISGNTIWFAPYAKFIFAGMKDMKPFLLGAFSIESGKSTASTNSVSATNTGLVIGGGAEYFVSRNLGIYGQLTVISLGFGDISTTDIGLMRPQVGIEWFFNP